MIRLLRFCGFPVLRKLITPNLVKRGQSRGLRHFYLHAYVENQSALRAKEKLGLNGAVLEVQQEVQD